MLIKKLSEKIIKQIAAGEVIARPCNALKELIENAIDAKATEIIIHIEKNGLEKLIISDNGIGMDAEDLALCTQLHTTSKTHETDHMFGLNSLGFRGEALASINAISNMIIESKGQKLENDTITPSNFHHGTRIEIKNMFANLPARLKFLRVSSVEWAYIKSMLEKFIANHEEIGWKVFNNEKLLLQFKANETQEHRLEMLFNCTANHFEHAYKDIKIDGYILSTTKPNFKAIFINKRSVLDKSIFKYMQDIFSEYYMKHEAPGYIINIEMDPTLVDCNVHPSKDEVRILSYNEIFSMLSFIFSPQFFKNIFQKQAGLVFSINKQSQDFNKNFQSFDKMLNNTFDLPKNILGPTVIQEQELNLLREDDISQINTQINFQSNTNLNIEQNSTQHWQNRTLNNDNDDPNHAHYKIIGQIKNSFITFETENGIGIFDQHAAHERSVYERMKKELHQNKAQQLLIPLALNLTAQHWEYINVNLQNLSDKGIVLKNNHLTHIPSILPALDFARLIESKLQIDTPIEIMIDRLLADLACKNALKANTKLSLEQMSELLETSLKNIPVCNHGRPVFKYFNMTEIENWFRRK